MTAKSINAAQNGIIRKVYYIIIIVKLVFLTNL